LIYLVFRYKGVEGLPTYRSELDAADQFEEKVAREIESTFNGVFALAVTHDGTRVLFFWMPAAVDESVIEQTLESLSPPIDFDFGIQHDPKWAPYHSMGMPSNNHTDAKE
jgi:hypothetical protein